MYKHGLMSNHPTPSTIIGSRAAADLLQISVDTLHRRIVDGSLEPVGKLPGRTGDYLFDRASIQAQAGAR